MDGVSGAASVATLLGIVFNIHSFISKLKNGPRFAQHTLETLNHLLGMLQRLENLPERSFQTSLTPYLQTCAADLKPFHERLQRLNVTTSVKRISWKSVQIKLKEEDIRQISDAINNHYQRLSMELQVMELYNTQAQAANFQSLNVRMDSQGTAQQEATKVQQNILSKFETLNEGINNLQAAAVTWRQEKVSSSSQLQDIFEDVRNLLQDLVSKNQTNQSTETAVETVTSATASDAAPETTSSHTHTVQSDIGRKIQDAIDILCELACNEGTCCEAQEAERLLAETQQLFELLRQSKSEGRLERSALKSTKRKIIDDDLEDALFDRELKKLRAVAVSETVNINMKGRNTMSMSQSKGGFEVKHVVRQTPSGIVTLQVRSSKDRENERSSRHGSANFMRAMFGYLPHNKCNPWISITLARQRMQENYLLIKPSLMVSNIRAYGSLGYELILRGNLEEFRKSLSRGDIYLNDRDPDGRSYLNYALFAAQPEMCQFLVEKGADVDLAEPSLDFSRSETEDDTLMKVDYGPDLSISERVSFNPNAKASGGPIDYGGPFDLTYQNLSEADTEYQRACDLCHRYLLEANADPSIEISSIFGYHIMNTLSQGTIHSIRQLIDLSLHHGSAMGIVEIQNWLQYHLSFPHWTFETVEFLISRQGTNGFPLQNLEICLHLAIQGSLLVCTTDIEEVLVLLIKAGADVLQRDPRHGTVSNLASSATTMYRFDDPNWRTRLNHDFVLKELWSRALTRCGFDAERVIETSLRSPRSPFASKSLSGEGPGAITAEGLDDSLSYDTESEPDDKDREDASEEDKCETIYDESEEDMSKEDNEMDDLPNEHSASPPQEQTEMDIQEESHPFSFLSSEDRMLLEQDAQIWTE